MHPSDVTPLNSTLDPDRSVQERLHALHEVTHHGAEIALLRRVSERGERASRRFLKAAADRIRVETVSAQRH